MPEEATIPPDQAADQAADEQQHSPGRHEEHEADWSDADDEQDDKPDKAGKLKKTRKHKGAVGPGQMRTKSLAGMKHCDRHMSDRLGHNKWLEGAGCTWVMVGISTGYAPYSGKNPTYEDRWVP